MAELVRLAWPDNPVPARGSAVMPLLMVMLAQCSLNLALWAGAYGPRPNLGAVTVANACIVALGLLGMRRTGAPQARPAPAAQDAVETMRLSRRDGMTGLFNRRIFEARVSECLAARRPCLVVMLDLDMFHRVNDAVGFAVGDEVLLRVSDRLRQELGGSHLISHFFSDDFGILIEDVAGEADAEAWALRLARVFETPFPAGRGTLPLTASMGLMLLPARGVNAAVALERANLALKAAQARGHGEWALYDSRMADRDAQRRLELPGAIARGEIEAHFQPIVELASGQVAGFEVLARWRHAEDGLITPEHFIALAEEDGLLPAMTVSLLRQLGQAASLGPRHLYFAVNISPDQLRDVVATVEEGLCDGRLPTDRLHIELVESGRVEDVEATAVALSRLREKGIRVTLDDFGAGWSNFQNLLAIPFDRVKIDKAFVMAMPKSARATLCVQAMLASCRIFGLQVTAEGVATAELAARCLAMGVDHGQGDLFGMPVPLAELPALLDRLELRRAAAG